MTIETGLSMEGVRERGAGPEPVTRLDLFPVPVFRWAWARAAELKPALLAAIQQRRASDPGVVKSNRDGWHSDTDLPSWDDPSVQELVRWCAQCVEASTFNWSGARPVPLGPWRMMGWANVNPPGGAHNISHTHAQKPWHWSACYYLELAGLSGTGDRGGALVLEERGTGLHLRGDDGPSRAHQIVPEEGELIIFPSWLYHRVEEHSGTGDRVTIAFNLHNSALERARLWEIYQRWWWRKFPSVMRRIAKWRASPDQSLDAAPEGSDVQP
jgi:uncharacterized protein (TIGR02466 family)